MAQTLGEIGTAVPCFALAGDRPIATLVHKQQLPAGLQGTDVERERQSILLRRRAHRLPRHEEGIERPHILVGDLGEVVVGECGIKMRTIAGDAFVHGPHECRLGPAADSAIRVGRDVGRIDDAERGRHSIAAGIGLATLHPWQPARRGSPQPSPERWGRWSAARPGRKTTPHPGRPELPSRWISA